MATAANLPPGAHSIDYDESDPFTVTAQNPTKRHRYAVFDSQAFSSYSNGSPSQMKRALEAHLSETERRLAEASLLGTTLVQQREELTERLKELEEQQSTDIGPELRKKLVDLEKEFNEVGRETARAFIPKSRVPSGETNDSSLAGGAVLTTQASASPTKLSVPSRRQRNEPQPSRMNDIELATEISSSLLSQVRELQLLVAEKDEALRTVNIEKSHLEVEFEGLMQRLRSLDESEQRYKDENWSLETRLHELLAASKESADREARLAQSLNNSKAEKSTIEREFEELKQIYSKLNDDHGVTSKQHESELSVLRRNVSMGETERGALQRKIEDLTNQNQELAKAVAYRFRAEEQAAAREFVSDSEGGEAEMTTPEHSPPPSPSKATPRHGQLESETLKTSLHHAYRMIQNLKNNISREKTEKLELRRMLQDARDELETKRGGQGGIGSAGKRRSRKEDHDIFKKPARPARLGGARDSKDEIIMGDPEWEDHDDVATPSKPGPSGLRNTAFARPSSAMDSSTDAFETATENETDAFETANERDGTTTESDFHTGAETLDGDSSDELTETERPSTAKANRPSTLAMSHSQHSYRSTASTDDDEWDDDELRTPLQQQRYKLRLNRSSSKKPVNGTPSTVRDSPASFMSNHSQPAAGQSLFAELGDMSEDESESSFADGTPSRISLRGRRSRSTTPHYFGQSPAQVQTPAKPVAEMVDSAMMTEPWEPETTGLVSKTSALGAAAAGALGFGLGHAAGHESDAEPASPVTEKSLPTQEHITEPVEEATAETDSVKAIPPIVAPPLSLSHISSIETAPVQPIQPVTPKVAPKTFSVSQIASIGTAPVKPTVVSPPPFRLSPISTVETAPVAPVLAPVPKPKAIPAPIPVPVPTRQALPLAYSSIITTLEAEPEAAVLPAPAPVVPKEPAFIPQQLSFSSISHKATEPKEPIVKPQQLSFSHVSHKATEPKEPVLTREPILKSQQLSFSGISQKATEPEEAIYPSKNKTPNFLGAVLPWSYGKQNSEPLIAEDETSQPAREIRDEVSSGNARQPLQPVAANAMQPTQNLEKEPTTQATKADLSHQSTQTQISSDEIDRLLETKSQAAPVVPLPIPVPVSTSPSSTTSPARSPQSPRKAQYGFPVTEAAPLKSARRPGSAGSSRSNRVPPPPLPADHREVIAAAQKSPTIRPGSMGPPIMPASAYRSSSQTRPRTPAGGPVNPVSTHDGTTPRPRHSINRSGANTPATTRRSSVSSFASELDERFNISSNGVAQNNFQSQNTDPRMIQAITQTMIGEYLWKYTRKTASGDMSGNRHRRFFWVHPYTRTLYWSEQDPATAGRAQLKAKSVQIEAVQVVTDDNPNPPGLHRKSIIIITPGRNIKFTATTGQRHETWLNSLTYLLQRGSEQETDNRITTEDVDEFNPSYGRSTSRATGRSMSSYQSRATRASSPHLQNSTITARSGASAQQASISPVSPAQGSMSGRFSSLSGMFRPNSAMRGSFSSRRSRTSAQGDSIYENSAAHDSAEDLRQVIERQEKESDRLENVRACCDGKHDVGTLEHKQRPPNVGSQSSRYSVTQAFGSFTSQTRRESHGNNKQKQQQQHMAMDPANYPSP